MRTQRALSLAFILFSLSALAADLPQIDSAPRYSIQNTLAIGGEGRWDYATIDPASKLLYVTRSTHTQIIASSTGQVVADIAPMAVAHGTAVVPALNRGFITDGKNAVVILFDLKTHAILGKVPAAPDADGIIYDEPDNMILVACGDAHKLLILAPGLDPATAKPQSVDLPGSPEFLASDGAGKAYVAINDKNQIAVVDLKTLNVVSTWPTGSGTKPTGMAIDPLHHRLFAGCRSQNLIVMSTDDGSVLAELPIGKGVDACVFDPATSEAFASCGDGTLTVVKETAAGKYEVTQKLQTLPGARTLALDSASHTLYLPTADFEPPTPGARPVVKPDTFKIVVVSSAKK